MQPRQNTAITIAQHTHCFANVPSWEWERRTLIHARLWYRWNRDCRGTYQWRLFLRRVANTTLAHVHTQTRNQRRIHLKEGPWRHDQSLGRLVPTHVILPRRWEENEQVRHTSQQSRIRTAFSDSIWRNEARMVSCSGMDSGIISAHWWWFTLSKKMSVSEKMVSRSHTAE
jgi:hypothetical protein